MEDMVAGLLGVGYEAAHGKHHVNGSFFKVFDLIAEHLDVGILPYGAKARIRLPGPK